MKHYTNLIILLFCLSNTFGQNLKSGIYTSDLKLAFDSTTQKINGYYENHTGWDEVIQQPRFSCLFFIEGTVKDGAIKINTYYPFEDSVDVISGIILFDEGNRIRMKLSEDHGGCHNVHHFANDTVTFILEKQKGWTQIRFVDVDKAYFYSGKSPENKESSYLIKNDLVYLENINGLFAYATFFGKNIKSGWLRLEDLNPPK